MTCGQSASWRQELRCEKRHLHALTCLWTHPMRLETKSVTVCATSFEIVSLVARISVNELAAASTAAATSAAGGRGGGAGAGEATMPGPNGGGETAGGEVGVPSTGPATSWLKTASVAVIKSNSG